MSVADKISKKSLSKPLCDIIIYLVKSCEWMGVHVQNLLLSVQVKLLGNETGEGPLQKAYIKLRVNVRSIPLKFHDVIQTI